MTPDNIELKTISKQFEYEKMCRELDSCANIDLMRNLCKSYIKLYLGTQEFVVAMTNYSK
jgi:hypothetical protein